MISSPHTSSTDTTREFDLVVLGATGITGGCVLARLAQLESAGGLGSLRWAAAGRDRDRLRAAVDDAGTTAGIVVVDLEEPATLEDLARRTRLVLNLAGPYTRTAERVIDACVGAGTSYVDLSGEVPLVRRVNDRFDAAAREAGVKIVQMAGWEAMPADLTTLVAAGRAAAATSGDGPGASGEIHEVAVSVRFRRTPEQQAGLQDSISGGTAASLVEQLRDPDAAVIGDPAGLLPPSGAPSRVRGTSPLSIRPWVYADRVQGPQAPVPFLNPPIVHRTAALLAAEQGSEHEPARFRDGVDTGAAKGGALVPAFLGAGLAAVGQQLLVLAAALPTPLRRGVARMVERVVPQAGSGPRGAALTDWEWSVRADAYSRAGTKGTATLTGTGHPGYTATAGIVLTVALHLLGEDSSDRAGCLTPALALGLAGAGTIDGPDLRLE